MGGCVPRGSPYALARRSAFPVIAAYADGPPRSACGLRTSAAPRFTLSDLRDHKGDERKINAMRLNQTIGSMFAVAALAGSALLLGSSPASATCATHSGPGQIWCPNAPSPGYTVVGANGDPANSIVAVVYGEGSSTYYNAQCRNADGSLWTAYSGVNQHGFSDACPSNQQYVKSLKCGDTSDCANN
jgi:hypothetical protein